MAVSHSIRLGRVVLALLLITGGRSSVSAQTPKRPPSKPAPKTAPKAVVPAVPAPPAPQDLTVKMRYVSAEGTTTTSTVSMKGQHQRIDYGPDMAVLQQCGVDRIVQINDLNKKFLTVEKRQDEGADPGAKSPKKGGTITYTTTTIDTGERKTLFGVTARHMKTVLAKTATPDACDKRTGRVETDGWFIDPPAAACVAAARPVAATTAEDCRDAVAYVDSDAPAIGYPLAYSVTNAGDDGKTSTMSMEATDFVKSNLPDSLFVVPEGYTAAANLVQLTALADGSKRAGVTRICAATVSGKAAAQVSRDVLTDALVISLGDAGLDAMRVSAGTSIEAREQERSLDCDYELTTEIADVRAPGKGMLGRISGTTEGFGAKVDFRLAAPGSKSPQLASSERSGGSTLKTAIGAAKVVSRYVTPLGLLSSSFGSMSTLAALSGGVSTPGMQQSPDPVMNTVFMLVDKATGQKPEPELVDEAAAVAAAMEKEVSAVAAFVAKKAK